MTNSCRCGIGALFALSCLYPNAIGRDSDDVPALFAAGSVSMPGAMGITFTPDGKTAYFGRFGGPEKRWVILESRLEGESWTTPRAADFSREFHDAGPALSPDGGRLFFWSLRPSEGVKPKESRLWVVERRGDTWGTPRDLGEPINGVNRPSANPSLSTRGTLYFVSKGGDALGWDDIYLARPGANGTYERIENLGPAVNSAAHELDVYVAPDESFILFTSNRTGGQGKGDIYISTRGNDGWAPARNLGSPINSADSEMAPSLSPDGRYLYFSRITGSAPGIYRVAAEAAGIPPRR